MEELKIELALEPNVLGLEKITHLCIEVKHDEGGWSCLTGENHKRGIVCSISPISIETHVYNGREYKSYGTFYDGLTEHQGFYVFLVSCGRKSPKRMQKAFSLIKPHAEKIKDMFLQGKYYDIATLLESLPYE